MTDPTKTLSETSRLQEKIDTLKQKASVDLTDGIFWSGLLGGVTGAILIYVGGADPIWAIVPLAIGLLLGIGGRMLVKWLGKKFPN